MKKAILKTFIGFLFSIILCWIICLIPEPGPKHWLWASESSIKTFLNIRALIYVICVFSIFLLFICQFVLFLKDKFGKNKFDYKSDYKKFNSKDKVKISFLDDGMLIRKKVQIISIDAKKISFEDKKCIYECVPSEIKKIKRYGKIFTAVIVRFEIFLLTIFVDIGIRKFVIKEMIQSEMCDTCYDG